MGQSLLIFLLYWLVEAFAYNVTVLVVTGWTWLYTCGLEHDVRLRRREEIRSDVWEQTDFGRKLGHSSRAIALQIFVRLVSGIPSDLRWRLLNANLIVERPRDVRSNLAFRFPSLLIFAPYLWIWLTLALHTCLSYRALQSKRRGVVPESHLEAYDEKFAWFRHSPVEFRAAVIAYQIMVLRHGVLSAHVPTTAKRREFALNFRAYLDFLS